MVGISDRRWFAAHPDRNYRCRVATSAEVEIDRTHGDIQAMLVIMEPCERDKAAWRGMVRGGPAERAH
jgi:hypothetical protein